MIIDGNVWFYKSRKDILEAFPYLTEGKIRNALSKLEENGFIRKGNFSKDKFDKTNWYSLTERGLLYFHNSEYNMVFESIYKKCDAETKLDIIDNALLSYIVRWIEKRGAKSIVLNNTTYYWISVPNIIKEMPSIKINTPQSINKRLNKLVKEGFIIRCPENQRLGKSYFAKGLRYPNYNIEREDLALSYIKRFLLNAQSAEKTTLKDLKVKMSNGQYVRVVNYIKQMPYKDFLLTTYWKVISKEIKKNAQFRCIVCGKEGLLNVHHRTYEHHGEELKYIDKDLICLCENCHNLYHKNSK